MKDPFKVFIEHFSMNRKISETAAVEICKNLTIRTFNKKHILINEGTRHDFAYYVIEGAVRSYYLKDGIEVNTWFAFENEIVGSLSTFKNNPARETIELVEKSKLISIDLNKLRPLMFNNIEITNFIYSFVEEYALFLEDKIYHSQMMTAKDKYYFLLNHEPQIFQRISLTYIASYLGISRETLSRMRAL